MDRPQHILLVRTDHLGDMLLTLPMVDVLRSCHPEARITVLASAANALAAQHHPEVDAVVVDAHEAKRSGLRGLWTLIGQIRVLHCDAALIVHPTPRLALAVWLAGIPIRVGTAYRAYSLLFNRRVRQHRRRPPQRHESEYNVELLVGLGCEVARIPIEPMRWQVDAAEASSAASILRQLGVDDNERLVAIHPGSAGSAMNWSLEQYAELGKRFVAHGMVVAITGGPQETSLTASVVAAIGAGAVDLGGRLSLPQLAAVLKRCVLFVGSSTGPTHMAAAVGTPVIALYSPLRSQAPVRWRPLGERVEVLQPNVDLVCAKCLGPACRYYHCMQLHLGVEWVEHAAQRQMQK
ncbi:MAG TPA: glycosyltransferase family 9 protein [Candidatus Acidoferrales bacterium]|nr:glycosyltransferase family 9 protein [Candidatus Acidoferrales bacterium]